MICEDPGAGQHLKGSLYPVKSSFYPGLAQNLAVLQTNRGISFKCRYACRLFRETLFGHNRKPQTLGPHIGRWPSIASESSGQAQECGLFESVDNLRLELCLAIHLKVLGSRKEIGEPLPNIRGRTEMPCNKRKKSSPGAKWPVGVWGGSELTRTTVWFLLSPKSLPVGTLTNWLSFPDLFPSTEATSWN
jgi:hypothetical protein